MYAAIDLESKLILDAELFGRHGTDPAAAFLHRLAEKHDLSETVFLVDGFGYETALARLGLNGRRDYTDRNLIEKWFQWIEQFVHYYNHQRPHQSLKNNTPEEEVLK